MNGFSTGEDDSRGPTDQMCCLLDENERCKRPAGNASYTVIQTARTKRRRKDSEDDSNEQDIDTPDIDLSQLQLNTLKRYKKHYKIPSKPTMNKTQLAERGRLAQDRELCRKQKEGFIEEPHHITVVEEAEDDDDDRETLLKHLKTIPVVEKETLTFFIYMVKSNSNKLDQKNNTGENA